MRGHEILRESTAKDWEEDIRFPKSLKTEDIILSKPPGKLEFYSESLAKTSRTIKRDALPEVDEKSGLTMRISSERATVPAAAGCQSRTLAQHAKGDVISWTRETPTARFWRLTATVRSRSG